MKKQFILFLLPLLTLAVGCDQTPENNITFEEGNELTLNATQTSASFTFTAPEAWALQCNADWLTPDTLEGSSGTHTVGLTATANTAAKSRTATIDIRCATTEATLLVTQLGTDDEPLPLPTGKLIKNMQIKDLGDGQTMALDFEYDDQKRVVKFINTVSFEEFEEENAIYTYNVNYDGNKVTIDTDFDEKYIITLDAQGRATQMTGQFEGASNQTVSVTYDTNGQIAREVSEGSSDNYTIDYTWNNGDIVSLKKDYFDVDFRYSEHPNTSNIDINWLISDRFQEGSLSLVGMLNLTGKRSAHYAMLDFWANAENTPMPGWDIERPVREDLIGTSQTLPYTTTFTATEECTSQYDFDADGDLTRISTESPVYRVHYERTGTIVRTDPNEEPTVIDGKNYFYAVKVEYSEPVETKRETLEPNRQELTLGY